MKKSALFLALTLLSAAPLWATDNLISNGDFETAKTETSLHLGSNVVFEDWEWSGIGTLAIETTDVYSGTQALKANKPTINPTKLSQYVNFWEMDDQPGQEYELTIHYKTIAANEGDIELACEWNFKNQDYPAHDTDKLNQVLPLSNDKWNEIKVNTTLPEGGTKLYVCVKVKKGAEVLFDDFSLVRVSATPTALQNNSATPSVQVQKVLHNGQIYIVRDGKFYTLAGTEVKEMR